MNSRDRAKVSAALVVLRDAGQNVSEISRTAGFAISQGTPARKAWERAFNKFVERSPSFHAPLQRLGQLIEASDGRTVAGYNVALSSYLETGDNTALKAMMPAIQQDMRDMAVRTGDAGFAEGLDELPTDTATTAPGQPAEGVPASEPSRPGHNLTGYTPSAVSSQSTGEQE